MPEPLPPASPSSSSALASRRRPRPTRAQRWAAGVALTICAPFGVLIVAMSKLGWWDGSMVLDTVVLLLCVGALSAGLYAIVLGVFSLLGALLGPAGRDR